MVISNSRGTTTVCVSLMRLKSTMLETSFTAATIDHVKALTGKQFTDKVSINTSLREFNNKKDKTNALFYHIEKGISLFRIRRKSLDNVLRTPDTARPTSWRVVSFLTLLRTYWLDNKGTGAQTSASLFSLLLLLRTVFFFVFLLFCLLRLQHLPFRIFCFLNWLWRDCLHLWV